MGIAAPAPAPVVVQQPPPNVYWQRPAAAAAAASASRSVGTSTAALQRHEPLERAASPIPPVSRRMPEAVPTPSRPAMVPTDPRSSADTRGTGFNQLLLAELDMRDAGATDADVNDMLAQALGSSSGRQQLSSPIARTDRTQTVQSMLEQAAELGVTVPRGLRKKAKAEIARYIDEQLSK